MRKRSGPYPVLAVDGQGSSVVPNAGAVVLLRTAGAVGLTAALSEAVAPSGGRWPGMVRARCCWIWRSACPSAKGDTPRSSSSTVSAGDLWRCGEAIDARVTGQV